MAEVPIRLLDRMFESWGKKSDEEIEEEVRAQEGFMDGIFTTSSHPLRSSFGLVHLALKAEWLARQTLDNAILKRQPETSEDRYMWMHINGG